MQVVQNFVKDTSDLRVIQLFLKQITMAEVPSGLGNADNTCNPTLLCTIRDGAKPRGEWQSLVRPNPIERARRFQFQNEHVGITLLESAPESQCPTRIAFLCLFKLARDKRSENKVNGSIKDLVDVDFVEI